MALLCANSAEAAIATLAIQAAGAVFCPVNPAYTGRELHQILTDCRPRVAVCDAGCAPRVRGPGGGGGDRHGSRTDRRHDGVARPVDRRGGVRRSRPGCARHDPVHRGHHGPCQGRDADAPRHRRKCRAARGLAADAAGRPVPVHDAAVPFLRAGDESVSGAVLRRRPGDPAALRPDWVVAALQDERITVLPAGATVFTGLLGYAPLLDADLRHLRICYSGASALPAEILRRWHEATGATIYEGYGQTEAGPILTYNAPIVSGETGSRRHRPSGHRGAGGRSFKRPHRPAARRERGSARPRAADHAGLLAAAGRNRRRPCATAGYTPAISASWMLTATSRSSTAARRW